MKASIIISGGCWGIDVFLLVEAAAGEELAAGGEGHTVDGLLVPGGRGLFEGATGVGVYSVHIRCEDLEMLLVGSTS